MANRERKIYMLSQKNIDYIEEVKEKNNLKYNSEALDRYYNRSNDKINSKGSIKSD